MGNFLDEVVIFLEEYYVYVIGVGLIIILMLIGFLASRKKDKKVTSNNPEQPMANINDVNTGSIDEVANTIQNNTMQPVDVVAFPNNNTSTAENANTTLEESYNDEVLDTEPVSTAIEPTTNDTLTTTTNIVTPIEGEISPVEDEKFNKTEIIDFSTLEAPEPISEMKPIMPMTDETTVVETPVSQVMEATKVEPTVDVKPIEPITSVNNNPFVTDKSQFDDILNGENSSTEEPNNNI